MRARSFYHTGSIGVVDPHAASAVGAGVREDVGREVRFAEVLRMHFCTGVVSVGVLSSGSRLAGALLYFVGLGTPVEGADSTPSARAPSLIFSWRCFRKPCL